MFQALHPVWLLLAFGSLLLLIGCMATSSRMVTTSAPATNFVTLTNVPFSTNSPQPRSTLPLSLRQSPTDSTFNERLRSTTAPPDALQILAPTCYARPNGGDICLGQVLNTGPEAIRELTLAVMLEDSTGRTLATQETQLEQPILLPNSTAPYRVLFEPQSRQYQTITALVLAKSPYETIPPLPLHIVEERGQMMENGRYLLTATVENRGDRWLDSLRLIVTLLDEGTRVVGYRVEDRALRLRPGSSTSIRMELIPFVQSPRITHEIQVYQLP